MTATLTVAFPSTSPMPPVGRFHSDVGFAAAWNGGLEPSDVSVEVTDPGRSRPGYGHFGDGILTFELPCLFRTEPRFDLIAQGPVNVQRDGLAPLSGIIETDWLPFTFTMNWRFTRPGVPVAFAKGEPICHIMPICRGDLEAVEPEIRLLSDEPELLRRYEAWITSRKLFNAELKEMGTKARADKWQKFYQKGQDFEASPSAPDDHRTRVKLRPFKRAFADPTSLPPAVASTDPTT